MPKRKSISSLAISISMAILISSGLAACSERPTEPAGVDAVENSTNQSAESAAASTESAAASTESAAAELESAAGSSASPMAEPMTESAATITENNPQESSAMSSTPIVNLNTNLGNIKLELDAEKAPLSVANFVQYAQEGHYDGTVFHRVIPGFMIQGGGFEPGLIKKDTRGAIMNEANNGLSNADLTIAMARTGDPHSATAQFFINVTDNSRLDFTAESPAGWGYAVFGKVVEGEEVIRKVAAVPTGQVGPYGDVPLEDIVIERAIVE